MLIIAHRGARYEASENSLAAFAKCLEIGCDRIELDLQLTSDEEIVVFHDEDTKRLCGSSLEISKTPSWILRALSLSDGQKIPYLEEVLALCLEQTELNLELKGEDPVLVHKAVQKVKAFGKLEKIIFSSFSLRLLRVLHRFYPELQKALLWEDRECQSEDLKTIDDLMIELECKIFHPEVSFLNPQNMSQFMAKSYLVYPWISGVDETVENREQIWDMLQTLGVDGLCTNFPRAMHNWQKKRKISSSPVLGK